MSYGTTKPTAQLIASLAAKNPDTEHLAEKLEAIIALEWHYGLSGVDCLSIDVDDLIDPILEEIAAATGWVVGDES